MKRKKILAVGAIAASVAILAAGTLALFTARTNSNMTAVAGTVQVSLSDLSMTNQQNINPGDGDPSVSEDAAIGTDHTFSYVVFNDGNKSIRTRQTAILKVNDGELDAKYVELLKDGSEIQEKSFILEDGTETASLEDGQEAYAVKYVFIGDVFDGKGEDILDGGDAEKESDEGVIKEDETGNVSKEYDYTFALLKTAGNKYQGAEFDIEIVVEAMQYRNTDDSDWTSAIHIKKTFSNIELNVIPAADEHKSNNYKNDPSDIPSDESGEEADFDQEDFLNDDSSQEDFLGDDSI